MSIHTELDKIFISRKIIIEMLNYRGYNTSKYNKYLNEELQLLVSNGKLDMLVDHETQDRSLLVHYMEPTGSKISLKQLKILINCFNDRNDNKFIKHNTDTVIIISPDIVTDTIKDNIYLNYEQSINDDNRTNILYKGLYIQLFEIKSLLYNIMKHDLVPEHKIITEQEYEDEIKNVYKINKGNQLPVILKSDPVAMFIGLRPKDVCRIKRPSETSGFYNNYRYCK